jgi:hypothetical protein
MGQKSESVQAQKKPQAEISRKDNRVESGKAKQRRWARRYVQCKTWLAATYNLLSCLRIASFASHASTLG